MVWKKAGPAPPRGASGPLLTAGGELFRASANGNAEAYDAKTGELLWEFQTGVRTARGPSITYEVDGEQYVAVAMGAVIWAFKLGGTVPPAEPVAVVAQTGERETEEIETGTLLQVPFGGAVGNRYAMDDHAFNPPRARVRLGSRVMFVNNGSITHTIAARDGAWNRRYAVGPGSSIEGT
jgi:plastocyanin